MSGPRKFKISDSSSIVAPPFAVKEWTDTTMLVFDFTSWLGPDQYLGVPSDPSFITNPQTQAGVWVPFPGGCCSDATQVTPPPDTNPLTLLDLKLLPGAKKIEMSLGAGTPGLSYLASFIAPAWPYQRRKEVGVVMTCFAMRPFTGTPLPPPVIPAPGPPFPITGNTILPPGFAGSVNINNTSGGPITITLPSSPALDEAITFKDVAGNAATYQITIHAPSGLIDGRADFFMYNNYQAVELYWTGTSWGAR